MSPTLPRDPAGPTHPVYTTWRPVWRLLAHVYEGSGGFLDGTALIAHPREWEDHASDTPSRPTKKLLERRALARYENVAALVVEQKLASLFRQPPTRRVKTGTHPWLDWCRNVDGAGRSLTDWLRDQMRFAMVFGHVLCVMDRGAPGLTAADSGTLRLRAYSPLDVPDWLQDETGRLIAIKALEPVQRTSLAEQWLGPADATRVLEITATEAIRRDPQPDTRALAVSATIAHGFGVLPVVPLYAQRRAITPLIGQSVLYDPALYVDLFNLTSEARELLRKETFSVLNVPLGTKADGGTALSLEQAQALLGSTASSGGVLFTGHPARHLSPKTANVTAYLEERRQLIRTICRLTATPFDQDSRAAESAEARLLKRDEFTAMIAKYAGELRETERHLAQLWFRGRYGARWRAEWDAAAPEISYPKTFGEPSWTDVITEMSAAELSALRESQTFRRRYAEKQLPRFLPDATPAATQTIREELAVPRPSQREQLRERFRRLGV